MLAVGKRGFTKSGQGKGACVGLRTKPRLSLRYSSVRAGTLENSPLGRAVSEFEFLDQPREKQSLLRNSNHKGPMCGVCMVTDTQSQPQPLAARPLRKQTIATKPLAGGTPKPTHMTSFCSWLRPAKELWPRPMEPKGLDPTSNSVSVPKALKPLAGKDVMAFR